MGVDGTDLLGGLGYYRRAKSLLEGAKTVMGDAKYEGISIRRRWTNEQAGSLMSQKY